MSKAAVAEMLVSANAFAPFRFFNRNKLLFLMYHRFSVDQQPGRTDRGTLERHLAYLRKNYKVVSLSDAVDAMREGRQLSPRSAVITIDDGYRDAYEVAFPIFKKFGFPATLYVVTDFVEGKCWIWTDIARFVVANSKKQAVSFRVGEKLIERDLNSVGSRSNAAAAINAELKKLPDSGKDQALADLAGVLDVQIPDLPPGDLGPLSWDQASEIEKGGIEIGSHTVTHPILTNVDEDRLYRELELSRTAVSHRLQKDAVHFCYPNGNVGGRERDAAEAAGFASAVTTEIRLCQNDEDRFLIPRIDAEPEMHRFVQATSGFDQFKAKVR